MAAHEKFRFRGPDELLEKARGLGVDLPYSEDISPLLEAAPFAGRRLPNRLAVLPMECADAEANGAPSDWTFRRYARYAAGGSGLIWVEATAVRPDGRSNPHQLMLSEATEDGFKGLVEKTKAAAAATWGAGREPLLIVQLTHSGRFSKPAGKPAPRITHHSPVLDPLHGLDEDTPLLTDEVLTEIQDDFLSAADMAASAGFDGVDIKACHGYLVSELLASFTRTGSRFGGDFENRTRFLRETVRKIADELPGILVTCRLSVADMIPFPYGFGMDKEETGRPDLTDAKKLVSRLGREGVRFLALSMGVPAWKPYFGRPYDTPVPADQFPEEHPLEGVARHLHFAAEIQASSPQVAIVGPGYSWLRRFFPHAGAAMVRSGRTAVVGLGRGSLAYPDAAKDLAAKGRLDSRKVCTTCSLCSALFRQQKRVGCVVRDEAYKGAV